MSYTMGAISINKSHFTRPAALEINGFIPLCRQVIFRQDPQTLISRSLNLSKPDKGVYILCHFGFEQSLNER